MADAAMEVDGGGAVPAAQATAKPAAAQGAAAVPGGAPAVRAQGGTEDAATGEHGKGSADEPAGAGGADVDGDGDGAAHSRAASGSPAPAAAEDAPGGGSAAAAPAAPPGTALAAEDPKQQKASGKQAGKFMAQVCVRTSPGRQGGCARM